MKLNDLANSYLKTLIREYSKTHQRKFTDWESLRAAFPDIDQQFIYDSLGVLVADGLISVFWADNMPYEITLNVEAIVDAEKNKKLIQVYKVLKELRQWL